MLTDLTLDRLLKSILAFFAASIIALTGFNLHRSIITLTTSHQAEQVVAASRDIFTVLISLRTERSAIKRGWEQKAPLADAARASLQRFRDVELPALDRAMGLADELPFTRKAEILPPLRQSAARLKALQGEFWAGIDQSLDQRRTGLGAEYFAEGLKLQSLLEQVQSGLFATIKDGDALIVQAIGIKQLAWMVRQQAGEGSLLISQALAKGEAAPDIMDRWRVFNGGYTALWDAIDDAAMGLPLPQGFRNLLSESRTIMFQPEYLARQKRLMEQLLAHTKPEMTADEWSLYTVPLMETMLRVADAALEQASARAHDASTQALRNVGMQGFIVAVSLLATIGCFLLVSRRITSPLRRLRDVTERLAKGDLDVDTDFGKRTDEIGDVAAALNTFREQTVVNRRLQDEQQAHRERAEARRASIESHIHGFEDQIAPALASLDKAGVQMDHAADDMTRIADRGAGAVRTAEQATEEATANVATIAAATEELNASIAEIARQVAQSAQVSQRAVMETQQTDETVRGLAESATRINEVVSLISNIAAQTNLLALNATIEAARAGEAGKGFAVVASEVKSLANQTARATEEISTQIASVRHVTQDAVNAITQIRATIDEVSAVSTTIMASVEEQGAAMQEIARNTQLAAERTLQAAGSVNAVAVETDATTETAAAVKTAASLLSTEAVRIREQLNSFMDRMRAA